MVGGGWQNKQNIWQQQQQEIKKMCVKNNVKIKFVSL